MPGGVSHVKAPPPYPMGGKRKPPGPLLAVWLLLGLIEGKTVADVLVFSLVPVSGSHVPGDVPGAPLQWPDCAHHR